MIFFRSNFIKISEKICHVDLFDGHEIFKGVGNREENISQGKIKFSFLTRLFILSVLLFISERTFSVDFVKRHIFRSFKIRQEFIHPFYFLSFFSIITLHRTGSIFTRLS